MEDNQDLEYRASILSSHLQHDFPDDRNRDHFLQLSRLALGLSDIIPDGLVVDGWDNPFFDLVRMAPDYRSPTPATAPSELLIGQELDFLPNLCSPESHSALQRCAALVRTPRPYRRQVAVVMMARNEGIYLPEWIAHYQLIGCDKIFIYTNDNNDGSDEFLSCLATLGVITLIRNDCGPGVNPQRKAYQHALMLLPELRLYEWALFVDADEFLFFPDQRDGLRRLCADLARSFADRRPGGVVFPWRWRLTDRAFTRQGVDVLGAYQHAVNHKVSKSLVNLEQALGMCEVHIPTLPSSSFLVDGQLQRVSASDVWGGIGQPYHGPTVEHFWAKSFLEFLIKKKRGDDLALHDGLFRRELDLFFTWTSAMSDENWLPLSEQWIEAVRSGAKQLLSDPNLHSFYSKIIDKFESYVSTSKENKDLLATYEDMVKTLVPSL